jgi:hypothetical protein
MIDAIFNHRGWNHLVHTCRQLELTGSGEITDEEGIRRWNTYEEKGQVFRKQTLAQHLVSSKAVVEPCIVISLRDELDIDELIIARLNSNHDTGELLCFDRGENHDVVSHAKDRLESRREYDKFVNIHAGAPDVVFKELRKAYLLQFTDEDLTIFPLEVRDIMDQLREEYALEIMIFEAIERVGHVVYPLEQYFYGNVAGEDYRQILVDTLNFQGPHLDRIAEEIPAFRDLWWPKEIRQLCYSYVGEMTGEFKNLAEHSSDLWIPEQNPNALKY